MDYQKAVTVHNNGSLYKKISSKDQLNVVFLGGSITAGFDGKIVLDNAYPKLLCDYLENKYKDKKINCCNLSYSTYSSPIGLLEYSVFLRNSLPDIVFVEFAVNDNFDKYNADSYESLIRKILKTPSSPAVIIINCCRDDASTSEAFMKDIADYYKLPSISIKAYLSLSGDFNKAFSEYANDNIHPNAYGHSQIFECAKYIFEHCCDGDITSVAEKCIYNNSYENMDLYDRSNASLLIDYCACGFNGISHNRFNYGWSYQGGSGGNISFTVPASRNAKIISIIHINNNVPGKYGRIDIYVNGQIRSTLNGYSIYGWDNPVSFGVWLDEGVDNKIMVKIRREDEKKHFDILGFGI